MKYIYLKFEETEVTKAFVKTMERLDTVEATINICRGVSDDKLYDELEAKQGRLVLKLTKYYNHKFGFTTKFTAQELKEELTSEDPILIEYMNQENISDIERQLVEMGEKLVELTSTN